MIWMKIRQERWRGAILCKILKVINMILKSICCLTGYQCKSCKCRLMWQNFGKQAHAFCSFKSGYSVIHKEDCYSSDCFPYWIQYCLALLSVTQMSLQTSAPAKWLVPSLFTTMKVILFIIFPSKSGPFELYVTTQM